MGVPKFFRYISERYPCLSELVKEYQIPEFDNLYLDMNGIVHNCSHPDDNDPKFRISEEKIFIDIFHYIEILFRMIRPQKVFFMAIDGVAPRAKMNQQRGRRFRSAKDAVKQEQEATKRGEVLPTDDRFDSNCITPGTIFMAKLHEQLQYFVANKISTDKLWQNCKIILSGHETPGEGEHKIMDYIRFSRAQPGYDPNTRHCLYGLDADLIMLGLCSHEPHFSLLREEVKFDKSSNKKKGAPEEITFFLLHLSLMREYLEQEFISIKDKLSFEYNIESVIDDWVLMGFLVGNDFIPHLPNLHINSGALPILYKVYMNILPTFDGYINENGKLNLTRFEAFMESLASLDVDSFRETFADLQYFESKTGRRPNDKTRTSYKLEKWGSEDGNMDLLGGSLEPDASANKELAALIKATDDMLIKEAWDDDDSNDSQSDVAEALFNAEFKLHKRDYYINKLAYEEVTPEVLRSQSEGYVTAIQWNLHYYYDGVCSWSWYYPHHYAPYISDIRGFKDLKFDFQLGKPFQPYEQLLAVLPADSRKSLPECYHKLMTDDTSPIIDYYPKDFLTDLNGKKQEWEAVVLIPFIDEKRLLEAMIPINILLTAEERKRNSHGPMLVYHYVEADLGAYTPPEYFPVIKENHAKCERLSIEDIWISSDKLVKGVYPGAKMDVFYPGFPTMKHLKYTSLLEKAKVKVFVQPSREESVILYIEPAIEPNELDIIKVATENLGKTVFVGWPHLVEAMVVSVSNIDYRYNSANLENQYNVEENKGNLQGNWKIEKGGIIEYYKDKLGIEVGTTTVLVHVRTMIGRQYEFTSNGRVSLKKQFSENTKAYPLQSIVKDIAVYDEHHTTFRDISEVYKVGGNCFMLGQPHYGSMGKIMDCKEALDKSRIKVCMTVKDDPDFRMVYDLEYEVQMQYVTLFAAANKLGISRSLLSRISGCVLIGTGKVKNVAFEDANKVNVGLNLKFPKKNEEVPGYVKKQEYNNWLYSAKALELIDSYRSKFPRLFNCLNDISSNGLPFEIELFPEDNGSGETLKRIVQWIKEQPYSSIERKGCDTDSLEEAVVSAIETAVDSHTSDEKFKQVTMQVKPHLLYVPGIQFGNISPDNATEFQVYDRVVNVRESFTVPLGLSGTIIAIHKSTTGKEDDIMIDVLFDIAFAGGLSINCSPNRGYRLPRNALINKSHGDRQLEKKLNNKGSGVSETNRRPIMTGSFASKFNNVPDKYKKPPSSAFASWGNNQNPQSSFANQSSFPTSSPQSAFPIIDNFSAKLNNPFPAKANSPDGDKSMENWRQSKEKVNISAVQKASPAKSSPLKTNLPAQKVIPVDMSFFPQFSGDGQEKNQEKERKPATDVLKALLKLDDNNTKQQVNTNVETNTVENFFEMHAKVQSSKKPVVSEYPSAMLMSYFVSNGMGCPLYTFSAFPENQLFRAEIRIPTQDAQNMVVVGDLCASRELASENVARKTLSYIEDTDATTFKPKPPKKFPTPPKQWCQTNQTGKGEHLNRHNSKKTQSGVPSSAQPKENKSSNYLTNRATKQTPFIPLQVTRQNVGKPGGSNNSGNVNTSKSKKSSCKDILSTVSTDESKGPVQVELSTSQKPKRERKMRIAAVFPNNPE